MTSTLRPGNSRNSLRKSFRAGFQSLAEVLRHRLGTEALAYHLGKGAYSIAFGWAVTPASATSGANVPAKPRTARWSVRPDR
jgi:hypothetical protein